MALRALHIIGLFLWSGSAMAHPAIDAFTTWCFKAGQTPARALANMQDTAGTPLPFDLTFWDTSLEPAPDAPAHAERRCEVAFDGDHVRDAVNAVQSKMATPPVFGTPIPLPAPYAAEPGTAYIEGRELLRGRVAVVHIGRRGARTFIGVDRLPAGMGLPE
ncbi:hypothetical protein BWR18_00980 [Tateyamaria omphalii]|uniref:Uncharacterized protein n=2 Tax=Tateyamaria omphalii TaxID=299262 RepID=A0A1P8MQW0_9RHOB|nr:hypothetical protein BWR18_00980 [Tateyamaria omphalii]